MPHSPLLPCPSDSGAVYSQCCRGIIAGETRAAVDRGQVGRTAREPEIEQQLKPILPDVFAWAF